MLTLINAAFDRSRTVFMVFIFLIIAGVIAYSNIPKEMEPDVPIPIIYVSMSLDGIAPADAERLLVRPMEKELQSITGLSEMSSTASESHASVLLQFDAGFDGDAALVDVREKVDKAKGSLPPDADEPTVNEVNVALFPVLSVSLSGNLPERTLVGIARTLKDKLEALPGVLEANVAGEREEVLEIVVDPVVLETYNVDFNQLFQLIRSNNLLVAAGAIDTGAGRMVLKVPGIIENIDDVMSMPVKVTDSNVVTFGDVADVRRTFKDPQSFARLNGSPTLVLEISKRLGANVISTIEDIREIIAAEQELLPASLKVRYLQDKAKETRTMLTDLQNNVVSGIVLVMIVIMAALGFRSSLLVGLAIPGSFLAGIFAIHTLGFTMNVVVLFSLILVVGMLVDGAIIVTELADRNIDDGMTTTEAYRVAARRMAWPVTASTFTTIAVFAPLLFWPGVIGQFMKYMPITVITCLIASLAMALVFIPVIGRVIGRQPNQQTNSATPLSNDPQAALKRVLHNPDMSAEAGQVTAANIHSATSGLKGRYLRFLHTLLRGPFITFLCVLLFTAATYVVYGALGKGVEFFPDIEPESMAVQIYARGDLSIYEQDAIVRDVESRIAGHDGIKSIYAKTGGGGGFGNSAADQIGSIVLELQPWNAREKAAVIIDSLRDKTADLPGIKLEFAQNEGGPGGGGKPVSIQVSAMGEKKRNDAIVYLRNLMADVGGFVDISDNRALPGIEWQLKVNREQAARNGVDIAMVGNAIQLITSGIRVAGYRPDDATDELDIRVRYPEKHRTIDQIKNLRIGTPNGMVPLSNFVTISPVPKTGTITRVDTRRVITVEANMAEGFIPDTQLKLLQEELLDGPKDPEVSINFKGEAEEQQEAMIFLITAFLSAIFLMTIILVTQFNSLYHALLILSAILFSTSGVLIGLMLAQQTFGVVMVGIGIIALAGIVVNNNIVLIDTYNRFRTSGAEAIDAALLTGAVRARPVCLTAITTILGLMPMVLSMNINLLERTITFGAPSTMWWTQMASAIAGGLAFTTLLTLFLTPCLLVLGANVSAKRQVRKLKREQFRAEAGAAAESLAAGA